MIRVLLVAILAGLLNAPSMAQDEPPPETALWKKVGNWSIYIDRTVQYQCFATILYDDYTIFRIGFQEPNSTSALYVSLANLNWTSIEVGKDYNLIMQVDNEEGWTSPAVGYRMGSLPALIVSTNQIGFVEQLMRKHVLRVYFNGQRILNLSLRGSHAALNEMGVCQNQVDAYIGRKNAQPPSDPFDGVSSPSPRRDPFAVY